MRALFIRKRRRKRLSCWRRTLAHARHFCRQEHGDNLGEAAMWRPPCRKFYVKQPEEISAEQIELNPLGQPRFDHLRAGRGLESPPSISGTAESQRPPVSDGHKIDETVLLVVID